MISAIAIDDEPLPLEILRGYCENIDFIRLQKTFTKTAEARRYMAEFPVDLLFLDIDMPALSGIDFYKAIGENKMVIFTTAYSEYAVEGFELNAVDYLLKPFSFERFTAAVNKARDFYNFLHHSQTQENHLFVRSEYRLIKIPISNIHYVEGLADYLKIHLENGKMILTKMTMKDIMTKLPSGVFFRVHRSYIVSATCIEAVRNKNIFLSEGRKIPIGSRYEKGFFESFKGR